MRYALYTRLNTHTTQDEARDTCHVSSYLRYSTKKNKHKKILFSFFHVLKCRLSMGTCRFFYYIKVVFLKFIKEVVGACLRVVGNCVC